MTCTNEKLSTDPVGATAQRIQLGVGGDSEARIQGHGLDEGDLSPAAAVGHLGHPTDGGVQAATEDEDLDARVVHGRRALREGRPPAERGGAWPWCAGLPARAWEAR